MNDKELLELAAKAAGIGIMPCTCSTHPFKHDGLTSGLRGHWNPLTDDGDRYRLIKALGITVSFKYKYAEYEGICIEWPNEAKDDAYAVVMVAAEIGRSME